MISVITATRRPEEYLKMVENIEAKMGELVSEYIAFTNDSSQRQMYSEIKNKNPKIKIISAADNYIYMNGFDSLYNLLIKIAKDKYLLQIFDVDSVEVDLEQFKKDLEEDKDMYGFKMYMQRGDVWETKFQLWKRDLLTWYGLVHENQQFVRQPNIKEISSFKVIHSNARDNKSLNLNKTTDGFIILEKTEIGTDSDSRNMLYESLAWKIVNDNGRHMNKQWFQRHYDINKDVIEWYHQRAKLQWENNNNNG
jgi:hypothetical protein